MEGPPSDATLLAGVANATSGPSARSTNATPAGGDGLSSNTVWWTVLALGIATVTVSVQDTVP